MSRFHKAQLGFAQPLSLFQGWSTGFPFLLCGESGHSEFMMQGGVTCTLVLKILIMVT